MLKILPANLKQMCFPSNCFLSPGSKSRLAFEHLTLTGR